MKAIFPLLLCYVLMTSQSYALSGGPGSGGSRISPVGTYSGVLTPTIDPGNPLVASNALGLFTLSVPSTLLASGTFLLFSDGAVYNGTITGSVDSDSGSLLGVIQALYAIVTSSSTSSGGSSSSSQIILGSAFGKVTGKVRQSRASAISSARLNGSSLIDVNDFTSSAGASVQLSETLYTVTGFRQSLTASAASTTGTATSGSGTNP